MIGQLESCLELLVPTLTEEQKPLWMDMDNALSAQIGEETRIITVPVLRTPFSSFSRA